jgi:hypothetical protein
MLDVPDEVNGLLSGKLALKYSGSDLDAMRAIANAAKKRSLADFNLVNQFFKSCYGNDGTCRPSAASALSCNAIRW